MESAAPVDFHLDTHILDDYIGNALSAKHECFYSVIRVLPFFDQTSLRISPKQFSSPARTKELNAALKG